MRALRSACACFCPLVVAATVLASWAAASEAVQLTFTADGHTTALYLFTEGTGTTVHHTPVPTMSTSQQAPDGSLVGAYWAMGRQYYAVATDQGYVSINACTAVCPTSAITVEAWIKPQQSTGYVLSKNGSYLLSLSDGTIGVTLWITAETSCSGNLLVPAGQWSHVAFTYSSSTAVCSIYVNGVLDTSTTTGGGSISAGGEALELGQCGWSPEAGSEFDGKIDSLRISNVAGSFLPISPPPAAGPVTPAGNLVPNGNFESGLMGWRLNGYGDMNLTFEVTGGAVSGQKCLHSLSRAVADYATAPGQSSPPSTISRPIPVHPGRKYTFSLWLKTVGSNLYPRIEVDPCGGSANIGTAISPFPLWPTVTTSWSQVTQTFTVPSNFSSPSVCVQIGYPSAGQDLYVNDVRLIAGDGSEALALKDMISVGPWSEPAVGNVFVFGASSPLTLNVVNTDTVAHSVTVQPTITDWQENSVSGVPSLGTVTVPANSFQALTYNVNTSLRGTFRLGFNLTSEGQTWHQLAEMKYAVVVNMQNVANPDTSIFAMNTHMENDPTAHLVREMQVFSMCGVKWIRAWWGWGFCENPEGTFSFTEYDRQYNSVTNGTGIRIMPTLLRYYAQYEHSWSGSVASGSLQQPPYSSMMNEWGLFCGKVAQHYAGNIKAYELWNEPGYDDKGTCTTAVYTTLLQETRPNIVASGNDPNAKVIGFAGCPNLTSGYVNIQAVLANGTAGDMDAVSEHPYSWLMLPEKNYATGKSALRSVMTSGGCPTTMPIWDTEEGIHADGDGYKTNWMSETDVAQFYARDVITALVNGTQRYFWFSADNPPTYGNSVTFGDSYIPRPRLGAVAACARSSTERRGRRRTTPPAPMSMPTCSTEPTAPEATRSASCGIRSTA